MKKNFFSLHVTLGVPFFLYSLAFAEIGLWTSSAELAGKPTSGEPWQILLEAADHADPNRATVSDQDSDNNVEILAAGIAYARTGIQLYQEKVQAACEHLVTVGNPGDRTLAWARETGAYALAADLVDYRTPEFELWLRNMAEVYVASDGRTLLEMFHIRPNNWGMHAFGSLCAIYGFLQDTVRLSQVRNYWIQEVTGPKPASLIYGDDLSWHIDQNDLRLINPKGSVKQGLKIDGITPDDMRRNGSFSNPPPPPITSYHWGVLQGMVMGARVLQRIGIPVWAIADSAIYRAVHVLQVDWENEFEGWRAEDDDLWMLPFIDDAYRSAFAVEQPPAIWAHGKNTGWPYVVWDGTTEIEDHGVLRVPDQFEIFQNYPNPFNPITTIRFSLSKSARVETDIYTISGEKIKTLVDDYFPAGDYQIRWNASGDQDQNLSTGIYLCRMNVNSFIKYLKMVYIK